MQPAPNFVHPSDAETLGPEAIRPPLQPPADYIRSNAKQLLGEMLASDLHSGQDADGEGDCIGPYRLCELLGEGGFGKVWRAEQSEPVRREVALKMIKRGMDTMQVLARFDQERQAMASMEHPCIAAFIDAGVSPDGRPYFAMELVRGEPITQWCEARRLPIHERLRIFNLVCQAVQHAHQKGIIHRDLKPTNILITSVDDLPTPKVIDFGIAKAMHAEAFAGAGLLTQANQLLGTPLYMSPEQIDGTVVLDTRSDVYSLGVLLYQLLTGTLPYGPTTSAQEMKRLVLATPPARPSTLMRQRLAGDQPPIARPFNDSLPGFSIDLDWITMRALELDRERRYPSAAELVADLQRFLCNEPVLARPPSFGYIAGRWIKRNRTAFAAACSVVLAMVFGTGLALWQARVARSSQHVAEAQTARASKAEQAATLDAARAGQTAAFLTELLDRVAAEIKHGRNPEALKHALADSEQRIHALGDDPKLRIELFNKVETIFESIGEPKLMLPLLKASAEEELRLHGAASSEARNAELTYIKQIIDHGDRATGPPLLADFLKQLETKGERGSELWFYAQRQLVRAWVKLRMGAPAVVAANDAMNEAKTRKLSRTRLFTMQMSQVSALDLAEDYDSAEAVLDEARAFAKKSDNTKHLAEANEALLHLLWRKADFKRGATLLREQLPALQARLGEHSRAFIPALLQLSKFESDAHEHEQAMAHAQQALGIARKIAARDLATGANADTSGIRNDVFDSLFALAYSEDNGRRYSEAIGHSTEALSVARQLGSNRCLLAALEQLASIHRQAGQLDQAYTLFVQHQQMSEATNCNYKDQIEDLQNLCAIRTKQDRFDEAMQLAQQIWERMKAEPSAKDDPDYLSYVANHLLSCCEACHLAKPDAPEPADLGAWKTAAQNVGKVPGANAGQR